MNAPVVRRTLVHLRDEAGQTLLTLDVLMDGWVRLRYAQASPALSAETLEDLLHGAAASDLAPGLYDALLWELDLLALRGGLWRPG